MEQQIPFLILSDSPTSGSGLGRITRDLATRIHANLSDIFDVGTAGYGGPISRSLGFPQYPIEMQDWVVYNLPEIWKDFAGDRRGVVMTIWDASRLLWFSRPENCTDPRLRKFLTDAPFQRWGYFPIDATGPHDKLTGILKHIISGYDRVLAYSNWASGILERTLEKENIDWLPHGVDTSVFKLRHRVQARHGFGQRIGAKTKNGKWLSIPDDAFFVGIVATNQARKDYGLGIATVAELAKERNVMLWIHIDELERHWSIPALLHDFGLLDNTVVTTVPFTDQQMSWCYSATDCILAIGLGEGFGFSAAESLACGTPVVAPDYGGGEFIPKEFLVAPVAWRIEGVYNCLRPILRAQDFAIKVLETEDVVTECPPYIRWDVIWPRWAAWLQLQLMREDNPVPNAQSLIELVK